MAYQHIQIPGRGEKLTIDSKGTLQVPDHPIIPFIEGDGIGVDITPVMRKVVDAAVQRSYGSSRAIVWMEIYCGEKAQRIYDGDMFPEETLEAINDYLVTIKGPLTTPVGGGFRSLNVSLRQRLDLFVCQRPVRWFKGVPSPVREPEKTNMVIFRENSEDIYAGIEWEAGSAEAAKLIRFLREEMQVTKIRFPENCGIGVKPISREGTFRLVRRALEHVIAEDLPVLTLVHKGNIMKFTEGAFKDWGYQLACEEYGAQRDEGGWCRLKNPRTGREIVINDMIADAMLQQVLLRPAEYSVLAMPNLNGDYLSDALAAQVGGIGIAPGANLGDQVALFEATHGTAPKYAGQDKVNPGSLLLSAEMMLRHLGWREAAEQIIQGIEGSIGAARVTYDFHRLMEGATLLKTSEFGDEIISHMSGG